MAKVIIEIISSHGSKQDLRSFDQDVIKIGRDYSNDLILPDGYVSENHLLVKISPERQIFIEDLQSKNGVFILYGENPGRKTKIIEGPTTCITSGEKIYLGNSTLRIFLPTHPVPETKRLDRSKLPTFSLNRKSTVWLSIIAVLGLYFTDAIFKNPDIKLPVGDIFFAQLIILLLAVIWSGVWAFVGQLIRRKAKFRMHLTIICLFGIAVLPTFNICSYLGFIFTEPLVESIGFFYF